MENRLFKEIGHRVQLIREKLNLLQKDLAKEVEISSASLSQIEAGSKKPCFELLINISKKFNVNLVYLLHGKGEMFLSGNFETLEQLCRVDEDREFENFLRNFLDYFKRSKMVRYSIMAFFTTFMLQNERLIERELSDENSG